MNKIKNKVAIIGTNGLPANYGGWETLVDHLTSNLKKDVDFIVYCSSKSYNKKLSEYNGAKLSYIPLQANGIQSIFYDIVSMVHSLFIADTLLILGVSGCIFLPVIRLFPNKKIIVNIDGIEWKREKWGRFAKGFLLMSEWFAVKFSNFVITDNVELSNYVSKRYGVESTVITYGGDHVSNIPLELVDDVKTFETYPFLREKYAFMVCRIEPENNLDMILECYKEFKDYPLVLVGNWESSEYGKKLKDIYEKYDHMYLYDAIYDQKILDILRSNAYVYIHGHSVGGTNPSLVEAMSLQLSILAFDVSYNRITTGNKALYFSDSNELLRLLRNTADDTYKKIGNDMLLMANENYLWKKIAQDYLKKICT